MPQGYKVWVMDPAGRLERELVLQPSEQSQVVAGLEKFTAYRVMLRAYTKPGVGKSSEVNVTTMEDGRSS